MSNEQKAALSYATKVHVTHFRTTQDDPEFLATRAELRKLGETPYAKGGLTRVRIYWSDGTVTRGTAWCSPRDNYNKSLGRMIAVGRAIKAREVPA